MPPPEEILELRRRQREQQQDTSRGRLVATTPRLQTEEQDDSGGGGFGGLVRRLTSPLVDVPELPGGFVGDFIEEGIESVTSPVGLVSAALIPVTGGTSLGLSGALGTAARVGTRLGAEALVGAAAGTASREVNERLPENTPGALRLAATLGAGVAAGGVTSAGVSRAARGGARAATAIQPENVVEAATPAADEFVTALRTARTQLNDKNVRRGLKLSRSQEVAKRVASGRAELAKVAGETSDVQRAAFLRQLKGIQPGLEFPALDLQPETIETLYKEVISSPALRELDTFGESGALAALDDIFQAQRIPAPAQLEKLERVFGKSFTEAVESLRPYGPKQFALDLINLPRAVVASSDLSYHLNQGLLIGAVDPKESAKAFAISARAFGDDAFAQSIDEWVRGISGDEFHKQWVAAMQRSGLEITGTSIRPEEAFAAKKLITKAFGSNLAGSALRGSERAYTTPANYIRTITTEKVGRQLADIYGGVDKIPSSELESLAKTANALTGRGSLGSLEKVAPVMNAAFFAPRFLASRFQAPLLLLKRPFEIVRRQEAAAMAALGNADAATKAAAATAARNKALLDPGLYLNDPILRMQAKGLGGFLAQGFAGIAAIKLAQQAGFLGDASVEADPRSSDFGKIRIGNTRYDFWGGYSQIARTVARTITQESKTTSGDIRSLDGPFQAIWDQFTRSKLSPQAAFLWDAYAGENYVGDKLVTPGGGDIPNDIANQMRDRFLPLFVQDVLQSYQEQGVLGAGMAAPALIGVRTNTFITLTDMKNRASEDYFQKPYNELTGAQQRLVDNDPRVVEKQNESVLEPHESFGAASNAITEERIANEDTIVSLFLAGRIDPKKFADYIENQQRVASAKKDEAARQFQIGDFQSNSVAEQVLSAYYDLYDQADIGWETGQIVGEVDWDRFDALEREFLNGLDPDMRLVVEDRKRAEHNLASPYFENKRYISESGYHDIADEEFSRLAPSIGALFPEIQSYGQLITAMGVARFQGDEVTYKRLNRFENQLQKRISARRERLRKRDPKLDRALLETGRTTTTLTRAAARLSLNTID